MSLSKPRENALQRPCEKYIKFNGDTGVFQYFHKYDKTDKRYSENNKGENVEIDISGAIVLDCDLLTVTGFSKKRGFCFSNEVRSVEDTLVVRYFSEKSPAAKGNWEYVKSELGDAVKFAKSIYLWLDGEIVNLQLSGASLKSWFDDIESNRKALTEKYIRVKSIEDGVNGTVEYKFPIFEFGEPFEESDLQAAMKADEEILQPYLDKYFEKQGTSSEKPEHAEESEAPKSWRDVRTNEGDLGDLSIVEIKNMKAAMESTNNYDSEEYRAVSQAVEEYNQADFSWESKKDKKGRSLSEYGYDEIKDLYERIMKNDPKNPSRFFIEAAFNSAEEEDDIPF